MDEQRAQPVVLIGAARSGTKTLRDALAGATKIPAVPYDVGYVWRHGNETAEDDCLTSADLRPRTARFVRSFLARYADEDGRVIEKSVGNCLRVELVADVLPEATFVHLVRDGVDVVESAHRQWRAPADLGYLFGKLRHFPLRLLPTYGSKFLAAQTIGRRRREHVGTWGPRYPGIDVDLAEDGLLSVCARQWRLSEEAARRGLAAVPNPVVELRYEDLVADPVGALTSITTRLGLETDPAAVFGAASSIRADHLGSGRPRLTDEQRSVLDCELAPLLEELGYARP